MTVENVRTVAFEAMCNDHRDSERKRVLKKRSIAEADAAAGGDDSGLKVAFWKYWLDEQMKDAPPVHSKKVCKFWKAHKSIL